MERYRIGIDVGGTFTDLFLFDHEDGRVWRHKLSSTPDRPHLAPLAGIREILALAGAAGSELGFVGLGTTVMTNALLERKGAVTGLLTTAGFRDLLEIARQQRPHTFDPFVSKPAPLVPRHLRLEVTERMAADGSVLVELDPASLETAIRDLIAAGVQSVAICFLHAYANPAHERQVAEALRARMPDVGISVSSEVLSEFREFERLSSTVVNAYLMPAADDYLRSFETEVGGLGAGGKAFIMNSGGGIMTPDQARRRPIDTLFSGPSGGVSAAVHVASRAGYPNIITFDMGGTSTDVCLVQDARPQSSHVRVVNGCPIKAPAIDVHTVGAGGSSIAGIDRGGLLQVGPHSAGARPGPACYGRGGTDATVTDANVVLGRLNPEALLGGALPIDVTRSLDAIEREIAAPQGRTVVEAAASIVAIADANMAHAVRFVSVERGLDPSDFMLVAFGGAGPVHAAAVARILGVAGVLVPPSPGVLCAMGVLVKDLQTEASRTHLVSESDAGCVDSIAAVFADLEASACASFNVDGAAEQAVLARRADVRYAGQNHELTVDAAGGTFGPAAMAALKSAFHGAHRAMYGYDSPDKAIEVVTLRVEAQLAVGRVDVAAETLPPRSGDAAPSGRRRVCFDPQAGYVDCPVYDRASLRPGDRLSGPAIVEQMDCTTVVPPDFRFAVDDHSNLLLTARQGG